MVAWQGSRSILSKLCAAAADVINATSVRLPHEPLGTLLPNGTEGECNAYLPSNHTGALQGVAEPHHSNCCCRKAANHICTAS